ncbi:serine/threonine-protein kinase [Glaciihabitans sp. dw_435]|uniref:serine/threonine-protein kinase n=1 Tax=Glaciihabitans sp. dw_435 TaxID=2720081 RepID=UPI001BD506A4|nr:serine/threonine-protein kinase [Glaciihabitans sp. dw_435]
MSRAPSTPPQIPGLEYVKPLGTGGFSDVFLYDQLLPRRQVAVKVLLTDGLDTEARKAFVDEANLMAQLSAHPYIVTIFHADVASGDRPYFVMEYCSGPSLADRYKSEVFSVADALRTGVRLSSAIATAHSAGILHRDIKPANVLSNQFGWPALTDFGISSSLEDELPGHQPTVAELRESDSSTMGQSVGMSVPWSPPEMFETHPQPDVRSDVFSLAATIHTLLAGRTPFEIPGRSNGALDLIGRIERGVITPIGRDDVPRSLVAVLQKGMATRREERYATAVDFARALQRIELELGYSATSIEVPNLVVEQRGADDTQASDEETRVRPVATIAAQAPRSTPSVGDDETLVRAVRIIAPPVAPSSAGGTQSGLEETIVRGPRVVDATVVRPRTTSGSPATGAADTGSLATPSSLDGSSPTATETPAADAASTAPSKTRRRWIIGAVAALVVVGGVVGTSVALSGPSTTRQPPAATAPANAPGQSAVVDSPVPTPDYLSVMPSADGLSATFVWKNPSPVDGDTYRWSYSEQPGVQTPVQEAQVTVQRPSAGARVCVSVSILRSGKTSAVPLEMCDPQK